MDIVDKIDACAINPWRNIDKRDPRIAEFILIHRNEVGRTPEELAHFFAYEDKSTGGRFPYHFFIEQSGTVSQCAPLSVATPGALGANRSSIQIVLDGDFRKKAPTDAQAASLHALCALILDWKPTLKIQGHTDVKGRSKDPNKVCPGKFLPTSTLRIELEELREKDAKDTLKGMGVKF